METCNIGKVPPIRIDWAYVSELMDEAKVPSDAELARRGMTSQSTITRARRGAASGSAIAALVIAFPNASLDRLIVVPRATEVEEDAA
ncbi:hypothetical protein [Microbacterium caowuchunii]|uniref:XRE family transcriptional regulator n=1 Tax=Microbacterium caowuchunii TaxID=2614638 RepID=A0A5N0THZ7_9MICO|nr:hypothetical protein [Microbacterium caowuchunii]KAA9133727.1 hypothetical protein F6B40_08215 [Microbacterium caowuchunii]